LREKLILIPLIALIFFIGIYPKPILSRMETSVKNLTAIVQQKFRVEEDNHKIRIISGTPMDKISLNEVGEQKNE